MRKLFGGINLTWKKLIIFAIIMGIYTSIMALIPIFKDISFSDLTVTFEVWILIGILIIMNSKSNKDSALKCFVFFLISQPLVYIIQDVITGSNLFNTYYKYWFMWTLLTIPMGFIGYYMKKDKWWGLVILTPVMILLGFMYGTYLSEVMFSFPRHLLTVLFCLFVLIITPLYVFNNKKVKLFGLITDVIIIIVFTILCIIKPPVYSTDILGSGVDYSFDDTYKVYLKDKKYGKVNIKYDEGYEGYLVHAEFKKAGKTKFYLESKDGEKTIFDLIIKRDKYIIKEAK